MAIGTAKFKKYHEKQKLAETVAAQMEKEQEDESDWGSFLSIAAPLAASVLLPGVGGAIMGGLGKLAGGSGILGTLLGTAGTAGTAATAGTAGTGLLGALSGHGTGALSSLAGGLLTGAGKGYGTYAISEGIDKIGREQFDKGGELEDIKLEGWRGKRAQEEARGALQDMIGAGDKGKKQSALLSGVLQGVDTMGGLDAIKNQMSEAGKSLFGGENVLPVDATTTESLIQDDSYKNYLTSQIGITDDQFALLDEDEVNLLESLYGDKFSTQNAYQNMMEADRILYGGQNDENWYRNFLNMFQKGGE